MHKFNIKLLKRTNDLQTELYSQSPFSHEHFEKKTETGEEVWVKFYNGDERQNRLFLLEVAENSPNSNTHVQTIVGNDGKTYKAVTGTFTIDGTIDTPDGQPSVVLYVSGEEESDYTMYRYSGELKVCRTVIYESDWQLFRHDIIINKDEVLENLNHFFRELRIWWNSICSKWPEFMDHLKMPIAKEETSDNAFPNSEEESDEIDTSSLQYQLPGLDLLRDVGNDDPVVDKIEQESNKNKIVKTLASFGIQMREIRATVGHAVTHYEVIPGKGVRMSKVRNLENDIALNISPVNIRIIAPIPGKGTIGIELPNKRPRIVYLHNILGSMSFQEPKMELPIALGKTIDNKALVADLTKMPHLLVAGATGQGKSVGLDAIITSLLYKKRPDEIKLVLIDSKRVELNKYASIAKHFMARVGGDKEGVITNTAKAVCTLNSLCALMDHRYDLLKIAEARNIKDYNQKIANHKLNPAEGHGYMPYVVVVIDEFADLIMAAGKNFEMPLVLLAQLSRVVGIHLVIATQRTVPHIITGSIKANFPARLAYKVAAKMDSITVLDGPGANQLVGRGDMLFQCGSTPIRAQGAYIDEQEVKQVCQHIARQPTPIKPFMLPESEDVPFSMQKENIVQDWTSQDPLFEEAARFVVETQIASVSMLQRRFNLGFNRAGRLMEQLASADIVTSALNEVLVDDEEELRAILEQLKTKGS